MCLFFLFGAHLNAKDNDYGLPWSLHFGREILAEVARANRPVSWSACGDRDIYVANPCCGETPVEEKDGCFPGSRFALLRAILPAEWLIPGLDWSHLYSRRVQDWKELEWHSAQYHKFNSL
jgi:hypothetical protein